MIVFKCLALFYLSFYSNAYKKEKAKKCNTEETLFECKVNLPQTDNKYSLHQCGAMRYKETLMMRRFYHITRPKRPEDINPEHDPLMPRLDQSDLNIALKASFGEDDAKWFSNYFGMIQMLNATAHYLKGKFLKNPMNTYGDYKAVYEAFKRTIKRLPAPQFFSLPSDLPTFTDVTSNDTWREDRYFVQRRLAGQCAYFIRLVNNENGSGMYAGDLMELLSVEFDWDEHFLRNYNVTLKKAISDKHVFVLYHDMYAKLPRMPDIMDTNLDDNITLSESPSPISLFFLNATNDLEIVGIQISPTNDSMVVTPGDDEYIWLKAKGMVEIVEMATCQLVGHLLETHATQEMFCNLFRRHMGRLHPIHQLMVPHCEGTSPVGGLGLGALLNQYRYMHSLFNIGYLGSRAYVNECYKHQHYDETDLEMQLKKQGLDDKSLIRYHPYRDDGMVIWKEIKDFAGKYVELYYKHDRDVVNDNELQGFVNELSAAGSATNSGQYKGFPANFTKISDVRKFLTRFIWLVVKHAANSYPLIPYGAYIPIAPTKLYDNPEGTEKKMFGYNLPNIAVTITQEVLTFTLASFRLNRLFDYSKKLDDKKARCLVKETFQRLNTCIQKQLEELNDQRFNNGDLTYQYMEPKWIPNSIHS